MIKHMHMASWKIAHLRIIIPTLPAFIRGKISVYLQDPQGKTQVYRKTCTLPDG